VTLPGEPAAGMTEGLVPGFVNAHTHIYSGLAPFGMPPPAAPPENFVQILERIWWRLDRALDAGSLEASARYYVAHALLNGTTTLIDHHESPESVEGSLDILADACQELGIRAVLCYGATERNGGPAEAKRGLEECNRFVRSNRRPLVRGLVGLHASFTVSDDTIRVAAALCRALDVPVHVHVAEDTCDVQDARIRGFDGPFERLHALGALPAGSIMAHGVHLGAAAVHEASDNGAWLVQNPRSNRGNRVGYPGHLGESRLVALGTDGYPSNLRDEAASLREEAAAHGENPEVAARRLDAGRALADLVFSRIPPGNAVRFSNPSADSVLLEAGRITEVRIDGNIVVSEGRLRNADLDEIEARAREEAARLWKRMEELP
jgi:cytosine/adenosine deaminase-related metal-dependent hydrolase